MVIRELITILGFDVKGDGLKKYEGGLSRVKMAAAMAGTAAIAAGVWFAKVAGDAEQNTIAFEVMLGSADKAKQLLSEITDFAAKTPFEKTELIGYAKSMIGVGFAASDIIPNMQMLGDIAAGVGKEKLPNIVLAFNKMRSKGKASLEELWPIVEAGVPIMDQLVQDMGVSGPDAVMALASAGKLSFAQVNESMNKVAKNKFTDMMSKQSATFQGKLSNIIDSITTFAEKVGSGMLPILKDFADAFSDVFGENSSVAVEVLIAIFTELATVLAYLYVAVETLFAAFDQGDDQGKALKKGLLFAISMMMSQLKIIIFLSIKFFQVLGWIIGLGYKLGVVLNDAFVDVMEATDGTVDKMGNFFNDFFVDVLEGASGMKRSLFSLGDSFLSFFSAIGKTIYDTFYPIFNFITSSIDRIIHLVDSKLGGVLSSTVGKVASFFGVGEEPTGSAKTMGNAAIASTAGNSNVTNNNVAPNITINAADGSEAQTESIKGKIKDAAKVTFQQELNKAARNNPTVEYAGKPAYGY